MAAAQDKTLLRKKAEAGKSAADSPPVSAERALGQALAKVAQEQMGLPLQVRALREARMTLADLPEVLEDLSMLAVIEGPQEGLGLMVIPPATLSALIEMQTMGRLAKAAPAPRRPTRIDAAMVAEFVDGVLISVEEALASHEALVWAGGFRYGSYLDDPRPLGLMFEDISYRVWTAELGFGPGGERQGTLLWVVPATGRGARPRPARAGTGVVEGGAAALEEAARAAEAEWHDQLEQAVLNAPATIEAVLHRVTLPLAAVMAFKAGEKIPIPLQALEDLRIEGVGRRLLVRARLGQHGGMRAVRLIDRQEEGTLSPDLAPRKRDPREIEPGRSPFPTIDPETMPDLGQLGGMGDPNSSAYDPLPGDELGGDASGLEMGFGGLDGFSDEDGGLPPLGLALDGFGAEEEGEPPAPLRGAGG